MALLRSRGLCGGARAQRPARRSAELRCPRLAGEGVDERLAPRVVHVALRARVVDLHSRADRQTRSVRRGPPARAARCAGKGSLTLARARSTSPIRAAATSACEWPKLVSIQCCHLDALAVSLRACPTATRARSVRQSRGRRGALGEHALASRAIDFWFSQGEPTSPWSVKIRSLSSSDTACSQQARRHPFSTAESAAHGEGCAGGVDT